ncbi:MAG: hypothetical protein KDA70_09010 [Planctomycetaceae bacterium]|nr:hypothetical protein [Planctomycetaceae bacterium]
MNKPSYESEIRKYYTEMELGPEQIQGLLDAVPFAASAKRWKRIALVTSIGLVAMLLLTVSLLFSNSTFNSQHSNQVVNDKVEIERNLNVPDIVEPVLKQSNAPPVEYRLVAFRSHNNQCPHCRATGLVFRDLTDSLNEPAVEMQEFDLSDHAASAGIHQKIREWKLDSLIDGRAETAFIALTDTKGQTIQEFKPSQGTGEIVKQVRKLINP